MKPPKITRRLLEKVKRKLSRECDVESAKVACIIYDGETPVKIVVNRRGGGLFGGWTIHAEERAIRFAKSRSCRDSLSLLVVRVTAESPFSKARPCPKCYHAIQQMASRSGGKTFRSVYYSWDGHIEKLEV